MVALAEKTSLKNKPLCSGDYLAIIIAFCSHSILLTSYAKNRPVGGAIEFNTENEKLALGCLHNLLLEP